MKIKITGCSKDKFWYSSLVGKIIQYHSLYSDGSFHISKEEIIKYIPSSDYSGKIEACDAVIVTDELLEPENKGPSISDLFEEKVKNLRNELLNK